MSASGRVVCTRLRRWGWAGALSALALVLGGCAAPAGPQAMVASAPLASTGKQHPYSVAVTTLGGSDTGALESSNIANADLKAAIEDSIRATGLFKRVVQGRDGDYALAVTVIQLSKPIFGATFTVDMEAGWSLTRVSDQQVLLRQVIKSSGVATMGEAFAGVTRLRLAVEAAARSNITQGLAAIGALAL